MSVIEHGSDGGALRLTTGRARLAALGLGVLLAASAASSHAQVYTWKDAKGVTHFSDQPPPDTTPVAPVLRNKVAAAGQPDLPYALTEAMRRNPVVLYTTAACGPCDQGRALLQQRGVPFTEKTVKSNEDQQRLQAAGSDARLPLLLVGANKQIGFEAMGWQEALTAAAYPLQSRLPAGWRQAPALAAAPVATAVTAPPPPKPDVTPHKPPPQNAPPGFQF